MGRSSRGHHQDSACLARGEASPVIERGCAVEPVVPLGLDAFDQKSQASGRPVRTE